ncbi:PBECR2 nuclease fold domain-containing protein [Janthinobacterium lividum]
MREKKEQKTTWKTIGCVDLRDLPQSRRLPDEEVIHTQDTAEVALTILEYHLGFVCGSINEVKVCTPIGDVTIGRENLSHIVEKRQDARERYVKHALATMRDPLEIWVVEYEDKEGKQEYRYAYIGAFEGRRQMLVVCAEANGKILWNFMHGDNKTLNKHRHGECIYSRL